MTSRIEAVAHSSNKNRSFNGGHTYNQSKKVNSTSGNNRSGNRRTVMFSAVLAPLMICLLLVMSLGISSKANNEHNVYKYYTSVEVASGDTLWTIADKYMGEGCFDKQEYINEVMNLNHMYSDNITAGEYLVVPYYTASKQ